MNRLFFLTFILLCSCASLNKVESTRETNSNSNEYTYSDTDSKIRYNVTNDKKDLHIKLNTSEFTTIMKIMRTGLIINFDLNGKKSEKTYFQYPLPQTNRFAGRDMAKQGNGMGTRFDLNKLFAQISDEAVFNRNGEVEQLNVLATNSDVKVYMKATNNEEMTYDLYIPLNKISKDGIASLSKLSVGITTGKVDNESAEGGRGEGMSAGGRGGRGGMPGGMGGGGRGGRGGMSGGGRSGGMEGGERSGSFNKSSMTKPIEIWFKLNLVKID
ncbi:MAG: hypothetical protein HXX14_11175 [Bacteroidetes bacterium]|nr:hypothetical protein [Bacteroidota bacterium]